jgi:hypothetical protein
MSAQLRLTLIAVGVAACGTVTPGLSDGPIDSLPGLPDGRVDAPPGSPDAMPQPAPTFTSITPDWGSTAGGTNVKITGTGFTATNLTVTFGTGKGVITVLSDTEIKVVSPPGPHAKVAMAISSDGGSVAIPTPWRYLAPLYAAEGRSGFLGSLYTVDPGTSASTAVGPIGFGLTGLAIAPDGTLYGCTTTPTGMQHLITVDPYTGTGTDIGRLLVGGTTQSGSTDLTFLGSRLLGWGGVMLDINVANGAVTKAGASGITANGGNGLAADAAGNLYLAPAHANGNLYRIDTTTGAAGIARLMNGPTDFLNALTFVGGTMYASGTTGTGPGATETLYTIVPGTGAVARVGALPIETDAIAGIPVQPPVAFIGRAPPEPRREAPIASAAPREIALPPAPELVSIDGRARAVTDVAALGVDQDVGGITRRVVPVRALAALAQGAKTVVLVDESGAAREVSLADASLALAPNQHGDLKLIDTRVGFHKIFGPVASMRFAR